MYKEQPQDKREIHFFFEEESSCNKEKGRRGSNIVRKRGGLWAGFFWLVRTGAAREKIFFLLLDNYSSKAGFLSLAAFGRRFLVLFSVFFFISYFQFVLEDD
jgi:hypothetical protein